MNFPISKFIVLATAFSAVYSYAADRVDLSNLDQGLVNRHSLSVMDARERLFSKRGSVNPAKFNLFPRDNRGETHQNRIALQNWSKKGFIIFDIDFGANKAVDVVNWNSVTSLKEVSAAETTLVLDPANLNDEKSPVVLIFLSNQQTVNDFLSTGTYEAIERAGITLAVFEYPGTGSSLGLPSLKAWRQAGVGAVNILSKRLHKKVFILGHSLGGGVVFDLPQDPQVVGQLAGVLSFGGIYSMPEASKTQVDFGAQWIDNFINPIVTTLMSPGNYNAHDGLVTLAKNQIPVLIMQGTDDPSVSYNHLKLFQKDISRLQKTYRQTKFQTITYPNFQHEVIFSNGLPGFDIVWSDIVKFLESAASTDLF